MINMKIQRRKNQQHSKRKPKKKIKTELNTAGQKDHKLSLEISMVAATDEHKMSSKLLIKVRSFLGATCSDMYHYLVPILERKPNHVTLHVGTNDVAQYEGTDIVDKSLESK